MDWKFPSPKLARPIQIIHEATGFHDGDTEQPLMLVRVSGSGMVILNDRVEALRTARDLIGRELRPIDRAHFESTHSFEILRSYRFPTRIDGSPVFGDHVRSKTDTAMANEALCKVLCHNLCCLIQSTYELGVEATSWGKEEAAPVVAVTPAEVDPVEAWAWV